MSVVTTSSPRDEPSGHLVRGRPPAAALQRLEAHIRAIERASGPRGLPAGAFTGAFSGHASPHRYERPAATPWRLGEPAIDDMLGAAGLETGAVHEIKPVAHAASRMAAWSAARTFAIGLAIRRRDMPGEAGGRRRAVLWCLTERAAREGGLPYGPGLAALGLAPDDVLLVEARRTADVLWAMEEGLRSGSLALVAGTLDAAELTPARRLALAAASTATPCLLLTAPDAAPAAATATRWRAGSHACARAGPMALARGDAFVSLSLERCRRPGGSASPREDVLVIGWCHEASRFRLAAGLRDRPAGARRAGVGAG